MGNWVWIAAAVVGLLVIYFITQAAEKKKNRAQAEQAMKAIFGLMHLFEGLVRENLGDRISQQDRESIAAGMVAIMIAERIPLKRLVADKGLFAEILVKSIQLTTT